MVAALQAPPRIQPAAKRAPARVVPLRLVPDYVRDERVVEERLVVDERLVVVHRQPRPRATRSKRAVYMRRRIIAASLGLGIVLTAAHAGLALGGTTTAPGRSPHPQFVRVIVQRGDSLWSIAQRVAPHSDPRGFVDALAAKLGTSELRAGEQILVPVS